MFIAKTAMHAMPGGRHAAKVSWFLLQWVYARGYSTSDTKVWEKMQVMRLVVQVLSSVKVVVNSAAWNHSAGTTEFSLENQKRRRIWDVHS